GYEGKRSVRDSQDDEHGDQATKEAHRYSCRKAPTWRRPRKRLVPRRLARAAVPTRPEEVGRHQGAPARLAEAVVRRGKPYAAGGAASDHRRSVVGTEGLACRGGRCPQAVGTEVIGSSVGGWACHCVIASSQGS